MGVKLVCIFTTTISLLLANPLYSQVDGTINNP